MRLLLLSASLESREAGEAPEQDVTVVTVVALEAGVKGAGHMGKKRPLVGDRLLTVGEVAATMRVSNMTVYRLIKSGQLAAIRVGKNYRIRESEIDRYLSERSVRTED
jgi:excisionase family DNA binding protein